MQMTEELKGLIEEFDSCMQAGYDELAVGDTELAEECFGDACYVLNQIQDEELVTQLANRYSIDPRDFGW